MANGPPGAKAYRAKALTDQAMGRGVRMECVRQRMLDGVQFAIQAKYQSQRRVFLRELSISPSGFAAILDGRSATVEGK